MMLLIASEELLTLFLTLETMTICLYLATAFEKDKRRSAEGGLKYFVYGSVSSALFLFGLSLIYGLTGSTRLDAIQRVLTPDIGGPTGLAGNVAGVTAVMLMLVGFGFKVAAVPFHQWAPDAYEGAPAPVTAWVATGSKVASFVAMMKVLLHALGPWSSGPNNVATPGWIGVVAVLSAASMTYGNFAALAQTNFKRMLAYSSIAHAGYMLVGVAGAGVSLSRSDASRRSALLPCRVCRGEPGRVRTGRLDGPRQGKRPDRGPQRPGYQLSRSGRLHPAPYAVADWHATARWILRQALHVHESPRRDRCIPRPSDT